MNKMRAHLLEASKQGIPVLAGVGEKASDDLAQHSVIEPLAGGHQSSQDAQDETRLLAGHCLLNVAGMLLNVCIHGEGKQSLNKLPVFRWIPVLPVALLSLINPGMHTRKHNRKCKGAFASTGSILPILAADKGTSETLFFHTKVHQALDQGVILLLKLKVRSITNYLMSLKETEKIATGHCIHLSLPSLPTFCLHFVVIHDTEIT